MIPTRKSSASEAQRPGASGRNTALPYEQIFDNALVGICFMRERRFVRVNPLMEQMLGYAPGELTGVSVRQVYAQQDDYEEVGQVVAHFPNSNQYVHERTLISKDGRLLWCMISGRMIDPAASSPTSVWVVQDLSDKKRAEDELHRTSHRLEQIVERRTLNLRKTNATLKSEVERRRASERAMIESREKYRVLIRNIPLGIAITDASGKVIEINPAMQAFFNVTDVGDFQEVACERRCTVLGESAPVGLVELLARCSPRFVPRSEHLTVRFDQPSGNDLWFDVLGVRVAVSNLGSAVVFLDRTEQRRARSREQEQQQQLAHATRLSMMGQFASALAHELGQPLNACLSYAAGIEHRLGSELAERPEAREALAHIQLHLQQAGHVVRNVRSFVARHRPGDEQFPLAPLVYETLDLLQLQLRDSSVVVRVRIAPDLHQLHGTRVEIQQVLVNLIMNAVEALRDAVHASPSISIHASAGEDGQIQVRVSDNGPGVPVGDRANVFEPYRTSKPGGLGMGLMMCKTIIESHNGTLRLLDDENVGAHFEFRLPTTREAS